MSAPGSSRFDPLLDEAWSLSPEVALRRERFGALAYHFGNRNLTFLKRPELVGVVQGLAGHPDVRSALLAAGVPVVQHEAYAAALRGLAASGVITARRGESEAVA